MQLVGERWLADQPSTKSPLETMISGIAATNQPDLPKEYVHRSAWKAGVMGAFNALALILACRLIVLVSVGGGIALTWLALQQPDPWRLGSMVVYVLGVVVPSTWLASRH